MREMEIIVTNQIQIISVSNFWCHVYGCNCVLMPTTFPWLCLGWGRVCCRGDRGEAHHKYFNAFKSFRPECRNFSLTIALIDACCGDAGAVWNGEFAYCRLYFSFVFLTWLMKSFNLRKYIVLYSEYCSRYSRQINKALSWQY